MSDVPPVPYKMPMINKDGTITEIWAKFFRQLFDRVGGSIALSNAELETVQGQDLDDINEAITTHTEEIADLVVEIDGIKQGVNL